MKTGPLLTYLDNYMLQYTAGVFIIPQGKVDHCFAVLPASMVSVQEIIAAIPQLI